jgi:hypothetical protein
MSTLNTRYILKVLCDIDVWQLNEVKKIQLILDSTTIGKTRKTTSASAHRVEHLTQRLIFQLHITRYRGGHLD